MKTTKTWTYTISTPRMEYGQFNHIVTVARKGKSRGDLNYYKNYEDAAACVESIKRGQLTFSRDGYTFQVNGNKLTVTRN